MRVNKAVEDGSLYENPALVSAFPGRIRSVTFSKPTLEDVFIRKTGRQFLSEGART